MDNAEYARNYRAELKTKVFALLGNKCVRCGFTDKRTLQIDHKYGGGVQHIRSACQVTRFIHILNNPNLYQILCANCNWIKRFEDKVSTKKRTRVVPIRIKTTQQQIDDVVAALLA